MTRYEPDTWQETCKLRVAGAVELPASVEVWSYNGNWGGEAIVDSYAPLSASESASLVVEWCGEYEIRMVSVSHRAERQTTVHFIGLGDPPFSPHAVPMTK